MKKISKEILREASDENASVIQGGGPVEGTLKLLDDVVNALV